MKASVFIGLSVDGFIARTNDDLGLLPAGGPPAGAIDGDVRNLDA